jgi:hypothetical protein
MNDSGIYNSLDPQYASLVEDIKSFEKRINKFFTFETMKV